MFPDMPDLLCALNWKVLCKFMNYDSDQDFFSTLLLKGTCHHELNNLGSGVFVPIQVACAEGGYVFSSSSPPGLHGDLGQILFSLGALLFSSVMMLTDFI